MLYDEVERLAMHPAWALLRSRHVALVLSFADRTFIERGAGGLPAGELVEALDDELWALNQRLGDAAFPRPAAAYLDEWAAPEHGWLRKYYVADSDEARYDLSPAVERALSWVRELAPREFVGTQSRLTTIVELLRQMVHGAEADPDRRLGELRRRRAEIDAEIDRVERGEVVLLDDVGQRDRYQLFARTARELLADFREVEDNFRRLDRDLRARIAGWTGPKGELLDEVVGGRASIAESDQGRSFQAFYDFLLSHQRQVELTELLEGLASLEALPDVDERLRRVHFDWIDASERTQATVRRLSDQLRRFLDDQAWVEQRRVFDLLRGIEAKALAVRDVPAPGLTTELAAASVTVVLPTERPLYQRPGAAAIDSSGMGPADEDFDATALLSQVHVDRDALLGAVRTGLARRPQVDLAAVVADRPLTLGLAELVGYLALVEPGLQVVFDEEARQRIGWSVEGDDVAGERVADLPAVTYRREGPR